MHRLYPVFLLLISLSFGCLEPQNPYTRLAPGSWRAVLQLDKNNPMTTTREEGNIKFEEVAAGELPFTLDVNYEDDTAFTIHLINGEERILIPAEDISFGKDRRTNKDTLRIHFPVYDSYIHVITEERIMQGEWVDNNRPDYSIPFIARQGQNYRFSTLKKEPVMDISGKWAVTFATNEAEPYAGIGEFTQKGNEVTGTFLTETGDYRYLAGTIQANKLYLSVFDGAHAFLFEAKVDAATKTMIGSFRSGTHYKNLWKAVKDEKASLKDAYSLTTLTNPNEPFMFSFPNTEGKTVSLNDADLQGKVRIIQIFGTWCPNCRDETEFLTSYLKTNNHPDLAVLALAFEKKKDSGVAMEGLRRYKTKMQVPYDMLLAGYYDKAEAAKQLPGLNHILSYPTTLFVDKAGKVRKIHTGFTGPATSAYPAFKRDFDTLVKELLAE